MRGGLVLLDGRSGERRHAVEFQYNPDRLEHVVTEGRETLVLSTDLDAADALESGDRLAAELGIAHRIAALRALRRPPAALAEPAVVLALGTSWTVPVAVEELAVVVEAFDARLNPLRAVVTLTLLILDERHATRAVARLARAHAGEQERLALLGAGSPQADLPA